MINRRLLHGKHQFHHTMLASRPVTLLLQAVADSSALASADNVQLGNKPKRVSRLDQAPFDAAFRACRR